MAVQSDLDKAASTSTKTSSGPNSAILMECLAELFVTFPSLRQVDVNLIHSLGTRYTANRQPGKALPYFLRLRRPNVFELIRENNLFTDVQAQVLLLVEFDHEHREKRKQEGLPVPEGRGEAITLLVDNFHSISVSFTKGYKTARSLIVG